MRRQVVNAIRWADPDVIFTNLPGDLSTDTYQRKIEGLECHKGRYARMDTCQIHGFVNHCRILAEFRGLQAGCRYADGFRTYRKGMVT